MRRFLALAASLLLSLSADLAHAYCRTTTCDPLNAVKGCVLQTDSQGCVTSGVPLFWPSPCVGVALQQDASAQVGYDEFERVVRASFESWNDVSCDGEAPSIHVDVLAPVACRKVEFNDGYGNANVLFFRDASWPYDPNVLALTTLTFGTTSGTIYDADMEIDAALPVKLTTTDSAIETDLQSILTHEGGHLLGIAHSTVPGATMNAFYTPHSIAFRTLESDDRAALCAVYPPSRVTTQACDLTGPTDRSQGFSSICGGTDRPPAPKDSDEGTCGCRLVRTGSPPAASAGLALGALVGLAVRRRRRRALSA